MAFSDKKSCFFRSHLRSYGPNGTKSQGLGIGTKSQGLGDSQRKHLEAGLGMYGLGNTSVVVIIRFIVETLRLVIIIEL